MPGAWPEGAAVRLALPDKIMGVAEGVETALSAMRLFRLPTWACLSDVRLASWWPPEGVLEVVVFGDRDASAAGQAAAWALAKRLKAKGIKSSVELPPHDGQDWNDVLVHHLAHG